MYRLITILTLVLFVANSCKLVPNPNDRCENQNDMNSGLIEEVLTLDCIFNEDDSFTIRNDTEYQDLLASCSDTNPPSIDFDQFSLLGYTTGASGCSRYYEREVKKNTSKEKYTFSIRIIECGGCEPYELRTHWVKVPRIPETYQVVFEVKN